MCSLLLLVVAPAAALRGAPLRATTRLDYDHLYHIGSPVDVFKHCVLTALLRRCTEKASPLTYAETHAGRGLTLRLEEASMLSEFVDGITASRPRAARSFMQISPRASRRSGPTPSEALPWRRAARGRPRHLLRTRLRRAALLPVRLTRSARTLQWRLAACTPA